jgi:glutaredoxin
MNDINVIVYTMKGCPFCSQFKDMLSENGIEFYDRDIHEYQDEYQLFTEITGSELIPSLMIIEGNEEDHESFLYVPEKDYQELTEALDIVKKKLNIL